jgi:ribonuclease VapC
MIVDTSAVIAILKEEQDSYRFLRVIAVSTEPKRMSAANYLEAGIVVDANRNPLLSRRLERAVFGLNRGGIPESGRF